MATNTIRDSLGKSGTMSVGSFPARHALNPRGMYSFQVAQMPGLLSFSFRSVPGGRTAISNMPCWQAVFAALSLSGGWTFSRGTMSASSANCQEAYCITVADNSDMYYLDPAQKKNRCRFSCECSIIRGSGSDEGVPGEVSKIQSGDPGRANRRGLASFYFQCIVFGCLRGKGKRQRWTWLLKVDSVHNEQIGEFPYNCRG